MKCYTLKFTDVLQGVIKSHTIVCNCSTLLDYTRPFVTLLQISSRLGNDINVSRRRIALHLNAQPVCVGENEFTGVDKDAA